MIWYVVFALAIIVADFATKQWALFACEQKLAFGQFLACHLTFNRGVAWSFFHFESSLGFALVTIAIASVIALLGWYTYQRWSDYHAIWGEVLVLAGALANMIDRLWHGAVIDFIVLGYKGFVWPVFNIADIAIVCGVIIMLFGSLKK